MASCLTYPISCLVADPFKMFLFVKRGLVIAVSFFVGFDQAKHRIRPAVPGHGDGHGNVVRRHRDSSKTAGANNAADGGNSEEPAPRRYGHRYAILSTNLSHDLPHSLGQACRGVDSTAAGRLFFKPE